MIMVIIGILAAVVITQGPDLSEIRPQQAVYKIKSDIRYAQSYALSSRKNTGIRIQKNAERYRIYLEDPAGTWSLMEDPLTKANFDVDLDGDFGGADITASSFGSRSHLAFDAAGKPYSLKWNDKTMTALTSEGSISLSDGASITVQPNTGKVAIE